MNQNLFNTLSGMGITALVSEMQEVKDAIFKDWEENPANISDEDYARLRTIVNVYEGEKQAKKCPYCSSENTIMYTMLFDSDNVHCKDCNKYFTV